MDRLLTSAEEYLPSHMRCRMVEGEERLCEGNRSRRKTYVRST